MPNPVVHFEVIGKDGEKLQRFYGQVFDWDIKADNPMRYGMISGGEGGGIGGGIGAAPPDMQPHGVTFYIEVANLDQTLEQVEKSGGKIEMPPSDVPGGPRMAQFKDPEGHLVGLIQAGTMQGGSQN